MDNINSEIYNYLCTLGLKHSNNGYRYIFAAICMGLEQPERLRKIEDLYTDVANTYQTTTTAVERSIRYSLASLKSEGEMAKNKEFIASAIDYLNAKVSAMRAN